jgi:hypothetical protein
MVHHAWFFVILLLGGLSLALLPHRKSSKKETDSNANK